MESVKDYEQDGTGLPKANVLEYRLAGGESSSSAPPAPSRRSRPISPPSPPTAAEAAQEEAKLKAPAEEMMK